MKWSLQELKNFYRKPLEFDEYVDASELKSLDKEIRDIPPVHVSGHADVTQQRATFYLNIQGEMTLPCANTLADVHFPFSIKTTEIFLLDPSYTVPVDEENLHTVEGHFLDLMPYIQEQILLEKPIKVVAGADAPDKKAPPEGEGWQVVTEEDRKNRIDPRLADLAKFFDKDKS
ncbi:YceD family protein [Fictibacillus enclensis]|uniref:YceD family protein n=1 Tax=Fictibacillus enclensis TaxID=1017270 RepID=UPI0024C04A83|nr:YceD family protein [Fictibacillus enclensis]MDM5198758.1 YceD family protein [Fictibacillus enclensis]MDM5337960.1 YceD family protein [Fictibacillus enclensis]WHY74314.1 YceD family protein [Fictibacillus enclensis]